MAVFIDREDYDARLRDATVPSGRLKIDREDYPRVISDMMAAADPAGGAVLINDEDTEEFVAAAEGLVLPP